MPRIHTQLDAVENQGDQKVINIFGGLNTSISNDLLQDSDAIIRKNWGGDETGALTKVAGYTKKNSTKLADAPVRGLFRVYKSSGSDELLAICNGVVSYSDNEGTSFTGATNGTGLSATDFYTGVNYNDLFFFTSPTNNLYHFTPATNTVAASTDQPTWGCKILLKRADRRMVALVNSSYGSTLSFSKVNPTGTAADDWSATADAGTIAIEGVKSDPLTGGATLGAYDLIFKDYTAFKVWDYPNVKSKKITGAPGCIAPYSVVEGGGYVFFLAKDGIYQWDGAGFEKLSEPVKSIIMNIPKAYKANTWGAYRNGLLYIYYTPNGATTNTGCLIYDVLNSNPYNKQFIWYERADWAMNCPLVLSGTGDDNEIYAGDSASTGFVYRLENGTTDNTGNITSIWQSKYHDMKLSNVVKYFAKLYIEYYNTSGTFTVNWYTDRGSTTGSYTITGTGGNAIDVKGLPPEAKGTDFSVKITHVGSSTAPVIRSVSISWEALYER